MRFSRLVCLCLALAPALAHADWPGWRGPAANAVAPPGDYPAAFGPETNLLWEVDLPGAGASTPVVWGDKTFLTASAEGQDLLLAFDLAGKELWRKDIGKSANAKHRSATGSNPSCAVDAEHVVAYFKSGDLACFTHDGQKRWSVNLQEKYGKNTLWWDLGTSPVLSSRGVVVAVIQEGDSYLVTLDLDTGKEVWKQDRNYERPRESDQAYTTPAVVLVDGKETIVTWGADHLTGNDAATGALLWERDGFNPDNQGMWRVIASPTIVDGIAYIPYGRSDFFRAVRLGNLEGDTPPLVWELTGVGADVPCPVVHDGKVYLLDDKNGAVHCLDTANGQELWSEKLPRGRGKYFSSPLLADGMLYCVRDDGAAFVVAAEDGSLLAENDLGDETVATPVPVNGTLLIRTRGKLSRFGK
jgi:outer membrane protein assembly factor BamB